MTNRPNSWTEIQLGEVVEINPSKPKKETLHSGAMVAFLPMASVDAIAGQITKVEQKEFGACLKGFTSFSNGDVIMAKITPCMENGKAARVVSLPNGFGFGSTEFHVLRPFGSIDQSYLFYFIRQSHFRKEAERQMRGVVGQKRVPPEYLRESNLPLPPLPEQHRIVAKIEELFSDLDAGIESLRKAKEQLKTYRQSVLKWAFEGKLTEEWRKKASGPQIDTDLGIARIKKNKGKENDDQQNPENGFADNLPKGWKRFLTDKVGAVSGGLTKNSKRESLPNKMPYLRVANVYANKLDLIEIKEIGIEKTEIPRVLLQKDDLLVVEGNGSPDQIGRVAIWNDEIKNCVHQNHIIKIRPNEDYCSRYILYWYLSPKGRQQIELISSSTSGLHTLSISKIQSLPIPIGTYPEQSQIVSEIETRLSVADNLEKTIDASLVQADALRQSILKRAFEGNLVPQDPSDEPAEKLLERIKNVRTADSGRFRDSADKADGRFMRMEGLPRLKTKRAERSVSARKGPKEMKKGV